mgnify:CR=1 FL=1
MVSLGVIYSLTLWAQLLKSYPLNRIAIAIVLDAPEHPSDNGDVGKGLSAQHLSMTVDLRIANDEWIPPLQM